MSFTPDELRRLKVADEAELGAKKSRGGRPRKPYVNECVARRRAQWRAYLDRKLGRIDSSGMPKAKTGRPRTLPDTRVNQRTRARDLVRKNADKQRERMTNAR